MDGPWQQSHVDAGAGQLIPVPAPLGGVVVVGESVLSYLPGGAGGGGSPVSAPLRQTLVTVGAAGGRPASAGGGGGGGWDGELGERGG